MNTLRRESSTPRRNCLLIIFGLALLFVALSPGRIIAFDVGLRLATARQLWSEHTVFFPEGTRWDDGLVHGVRGATSFYGIGQSLVFIPFDLLGAGLAKLAALFSESFSKFADPLPVVFFYVPLAGLFWWWSIANLLEELGLGHSRAFAAAFVATSICLVYCSQTAQEEAMVGAIVTSSVVSWIRWYRTRSVGWARVAGFCAAVAPVFRLSSALVALILLGVSVDDFLRRTSAAYDWKAARRGILFGLLGAVGPMLVFMIFSYWRFGAPFSTGYDHAGPGGTVTDRAAAVEWTTARFGLALAFAFGAGKGLFVLSPTLLFTFRKFGEVWKTRPALWTSVVAAFLLSFWLHSKIVNNPDGSECWGVRYQVSLIGFLAYPACVGWLAVWRSKRWRGIAAAVALVGLLIQGLAGFAPDAIEYVQSDLAGMHRYRLIAGLTTGQLFRRASNAATWVTGKSVTTAATKKQISEMEDRFVPNFWGFAYAKKTSNGVLKAASVGIWALCLIAGLSLLAWGFAIGRRN